MNSSKKVAEEKTLPNFFYEALIPKLEKDITENYRPIFIMNMEAKSHS